MPPRITSAFGMGEGSPGSSSPAWATRFALCAVLLALISPLTFADPDMFHAMAVFREALRTGWLPMRDDFAYTPTVVPFVHHEWGAGAILYGVMVAAGLGAWGLMALKYLITTGIVVGCFVCARRSGATEPLLTILAPVAMLLGWIGFTTIRPQLYTLLFAVVLLLMLEADRRGRRAWVALWLPLHVVWLNVHGGFLVGSGLLLLHAGEQLVRTYLERRSLRASLARHWHLPATLAAMTALVLVNPYGPAFAAHLFEATRLERPLVREWGALWTSPDAIWAMAAWTLSLLAVAYAAARRGWTRLPGLPLVLVTAVLALQHLRHGSIYAVVWICLVPGYLRDTPLRVSLHALWIRHRRALVATGILLGLAYGSVAVEHRFWELRAPTRRAMGPLLYPAGAVDYLASTGFRGNLMTPFRAGAFVSWKLHPDVRVSFDGRWEAAYPPAALAENLAFYDAEDGWDATLAHHATDAVLVPYFSPIGPRLAETPGWVRVYHDDGYALFVTRALADELPRVDHSGRPLRVAIP